jgi:hypothetical protein
MNKLNGFKNYKYLSFLGFFFILFFIIRADIFVDYYFNIDELVYLYLLKRSEIFYLPFLGFDTQTSGPTTILLLKLFQGIGIKINLVNYRFILFSLSSISLIYFSCKIFTNSIKVLLIVGITISSLFYIKHLDFIAVNTEYSIIGIVPVLLFLAFKKETKRFDLILFSLLINILFFTKFQAIILVGMLSVLFIYKLYINKLLTLLKEYILINVLFIAFLLIFFQYLGILNDFIHNYIIRNLQYPKLKISPPFFETFQSNTIILIKYFSPYFLLIFINLLFYRIKKKISKSKERTYVALIKDKKSFLILLFIFVILILLIKYKLGYNLNHILSPIVNKTVSCLVLIMSLYLTISLLIKVQWKTTFNKENLLKNYKFSGILLITIVIYFSILLAKYNFIHYFVLFFIPIIYWIAYIINKNQSSKIILINLLVLAFIFFYQTIENRENNSKMINLIESQKVERMVLKKITNLLVNKSSQETILILGFYKAVPFYYRLSQNFNFCYRAANTQFITLFYLKGRKNKFFKVEDNNLYYDIMRSKPKYIIDTDNILSKISKSKSVALIMRNYKLDTLTEIGVIYKTTN